MPRNIWDPDAAEMDNEADILAGMVEEPYAYYDNVTTTVDLQPTTFVGYFVPNQPAPFSPPVEGMLTDVYNAYTRGRGYHPIEILVGQRIFDEFSASLQAYQRFTAVEAENNGNRILMFRASHLSVDPNARNEYSIRIIPQRDLNVENAETEAGL